MSAAEKATNSTDASSTDASDDAGLRRRRRVLVTGALGGRFDHEMSHLSCLHAFADTEIVLVGRTSTARLIPAGVTTIVPDLEAEGPTCGLFPMLGPATVTTSGLRWDLDRQRLAFGTLISTSNEMLGRNAGDDPPRRVVPEARRALGRGDRVYIGPVDRTGSVRLGVWGHGRART